MKHVGFEDGSFDDKVPFTFLPPPFRTVGFPSFECVFIESSSLLFSVGPTLLIS